MNKTSFLALLLIFQNWIWADTLDLQKPIVGMVEFDLLNDIGTPDAGKVIPGLMSPYLKKLTPWELEERVFFKKVINEQILQETLLDRSEEAMEIGKIHGSSHILTGSALRIGRERIINAKLINVSTAEIQKASTIRYTADEGLEEALEKLSWKISGKSDREIYSEWVDRSLRRGSLGAAIGLGWGHTRSEQWLKPENAVSQYSKGEEITMGGVSLDAIWHGYKWDMGLMGIVPNNVGMLGAQIAYHPWTHVGFGFVGIWQNSTIVQNGYERGSLDLKTPMLMLSLRPSAQFRLAFAKGRSEIGTLRYRDANGTQSPLDLEVQMDWLEGPTLAQIEYSFKDSPWFLIGRYFHDREHSIVASEGTNRRYVELLERWAFVGLGAHFALH